MIGEVALLGIFTLISIQDALQEKIDDYFSGMLWLCYVFLFPGANLYVAFASFGLLVILCRYVESCPNIRGKGFLGWGDVIVLPILISFVMSLNGVYGVILWLLLGMTLGMLTSYIQKKDKAPLMPMLWVSFLILELIFVFAGTFLSTLG